MKHDYLVVGSGLAGATFAQQAKEKGKSVLVVEKRSHIAGNCFTQEMDGIHVHMYGGHILHTNDEGLWAYISKFGKIRQYEHRVKAYYKGRYYSLPLNRETFIQVYGARPDGTPDMLSHFRLYPNPAKDLETWIVNEVGRPIYEMFFEGYTTKQWGRHPKDLPASIIKRLPIRYNFDDRYFSDEHQGVPEKGYTQLVANMLDGVKVELGVDYFAERKRLDRMAEQVIYTGPVDAYFGCSLGRLEYRSLRHEHHYAKADIQGCATVNYTGLEAPYTRILEHKYYGYLGTWIPHSWTTYEFPEEYDGTNEPFYPIRDAKNTELYGKYKEMADALPDVYFTGRLATYTYQDMIPTVAQALKLAKELL